jgi:hypothetical protein
MIDRTSIIRLNELHNDDLPEIVQRNPDLKQLIESLKAMSPEEAEAWKEEVRQSRLNDWDDADDDEEVDAATVVDDENVDGGNSSIEKHDEQ